MVALTPRRARRGIAALALVTAVAGCEYFAPTRPKPPDEGPTLLGDYTLPESTLSSVAKAIEAKGGGGSEVYRVAFADSTGPTTPAYHQFFALEDEREYEQGGQEAPDWTLRDEITFYAYFVSYRPGDYAVIWEKDPTRPDDLTNPDVAELHRHYTVTAVSGSSSVVIAIGYADLVLVKGPDAKWQITIWEDRRDPGADPGTEERTLGWRRLNSQGGT